VGGAVGSLLAGAAWSELGWSGAALAGLALSTVAGIAHVVAARSRSTAHAHARAAVTES